MKGLFIAACLLLAAASIRADVVDTYLEKSKDKVLTCAKEMGITEQNVRAIYDMDSNTGIDKATCLRECIMKLYGTMQNSKVSIDKMKEYIRFVFDEQQNPEMIKTLEKAAIDCVDKVKDITDPCKLAYSYVECYMDKH